MTTTVSSKGQITLPRFVREALGLKPGSTVSFALEPGEVRLRPVIPGTARRLAASLRRYAKPGRPRAVRAHVKREVARGTATTPPR